MKLENIDNAEQAIKMLKQSIKVADVLDGNKITKVQVFLKDNKDGQAGSVTMSLDDDSEFSESIMRVFCHHVRKAFLCVRDESELEIERL